MSIIDDIKIHQNFGDKYEFEKDYRRSLNQDDYKIADSMFLEGNGYRKIAEKLGVKSYELRYHFKVTAEKILQNNEEYPEFLRRFGKMLLDETNITKSRFTTIVRKIAEKDDTIYAKIFGEEKAAEAEQFIIDAEEEHKRKKDVLRRI